MSCIIAGFSSVTSPSPEFISLEFSPEVSLASDENVEPRSMFHPEAPEAYSSADARNVWSAGRVVGMSSVSFASGCFSSGTVIVSGADTLISD